MHRGLGCLDPIVIACVALLSALITENYHVACLVLDEMFNQVSSMSDHIHSARA
jgi:hypothetical protein